ncbi:hypothetical protein Megpolyxen_01789 (plasmid) [Candidatus Megaera polyxenophila]|nr:hypothetical protein Megpolyxen_01789 [Candidatus Megaera polyxenophila]
MKNTKGYFFNIYKVVSQFKLTEKLPNNLKEFLLSPEEITKLKNEE